MSAVFAANRFRDHVQPHRGQCAARATGPAQWRLTKTGPRFNRRLTLVSRMGLSYQLRTLTEEEGPFYSSHTSALVYQLAVQNVNLWKKRIGKEKREQIGKSQTGPYWMGWGWPAQRSWFLIFRWWLLLHLIHHLIVPRSLDIWSPQMSLRESLLRQF